MQTLSVSPTEHQLQAQINPGHNDLQIRNQGNPGDPFPEFLKHKLTKFPNAIPTWILSKTGTTPSPSEGAHLGSHSPIVMLTLSTVETSRIHRPGYGRALQ